MTEKLKNKINDEQLKIRAISDEKITVKLTNNYAFQKIFKNTKIVKGFLMALLDLNEYSYAAEPPVQFRLSHLSRRSEPL